MADAGGDIVLVGGGKMGGALLTGWCKSGVDAAHIHAVEPDENNRARLASQGVTAVSERAALSLSAPPTIVLFAVKPQMMPAVLPDYAGIGDTSTLYLSIAAGCKLALLESALGQIAAVRAMPNTPAAIGHGMTVVCPNSKVDGAQRALAERLLSAVGDVAWVDDEALMDPVTAVSGSGPAYVFLLIEALAAAGVKAGLPADLAMRLAKTTVEGAGALALGADEPPDQLRINVTSPGGTTAAALDVLMAADGLPALMERAVAAASARSRELAG
jgi:pyrroline-5-carboxylate reductase